MTTHRKSRHISRTYPSDKDSTGVDLLPIHALGGSVLGFFVFFLGSEAVLSTRPHPLHWLAAIGGAALLYLVGLFYARRKATHTHRKARL